MTDGSTKTFSLASHSNDKSWNGDNDNDGDNNNDDDDDDDDDDGDDDDDRTYEAARIWSQPTKKNWGKHPI